MAHQCAAPIRALPFYFVCYFTGCCEEGFEQPVPAVLRPGGQKQSCGLFLGRGSANPSWPTNAQHLPGAAFFVLHGRAAVHARRKTSGTARSRFARCLSRIVGAACMRPVKRCTHHPFTVCMVFASHGRAGDFARRTDDFSNFKNNNVGRGQDPALQTGANGQPTVTPARGAPLPGGIYASPTNTRYRVHNPKTVCPTIPFLARDGVRSMRRGGIQAVPHSHWQKRYGM